MYTILIHNVPRRQHTYLDWHSCAVQPKWKEAFLPLQRLVTNSKLQEQMRTGKAQRKGATNSEYGYVIDKSLKC